jgi:hypothetical protein
MAVDKPVGDNARKGANPPSRGADPTPQRALIIAAMVYRGNASPGDDTHLLIWHAVSACLARRKSPPLAALPIGSVSASCLNRRASSL